ncbi:MAG TPA: hypothetical protein ENK44_01650 [Caldithrix abyssi]|uniref:Soluble ligand binding domain-containing protein n=2 Tax=Caldithrix abyssi TaxID=187145 RepID=A0A7V4TYA7_CALAY|nr:hypothetical protein [Caldithrix abyssi]
MNKRLRLSISILLSICFQVVSAQQLPLPVQDAGTDRMKSSQYTFELGQQDFSSLLKSDKLNLGIDPATYHIGSGDQFALKIDSRGPGIKLYQAIVTPDGFVFLPEATSIYIKDLTADKARERIKKVLRKKFPNAFVEVFLAQLHYVNVMFISPLMNGGEMQFPSNTRLFTATSYFLQQWEERRNRQIIQKPQSTLDNPNDSKYFVPEDLDSVYKKPEYKPSLRRIQVIRRGKKSSYDLLKYKQTGDSRLNVYLQQEDIIVVPGFNPDHGSIRIHGAVVNEFEFEFMPGDRLMDAIDFAGGLVNGADSARILVYHYGKSAEKINLSRLSLPADSSFRLAAEDEILVNYLPRKFSRGKVRIVGEVEYPGEYPIVDNGITVSELIREAGGFTPRASLRDSRIYRTRFYKGEENLGVFLRLRPQYMDVNLLSYIGIRAREEVRQLAYDFTGIDDRKESEDVLLRDGDIIYIPQPVGIVYLSGAVARPGSYPYREGWNYEQYVAEAGGFTNIAHSGSTRLIRGGTGSWVEAEDDIPIYPGDMVFVPETSETQWQIVMKDIAITLGQLATVALIISRIYSGN